MCVPLLCGFVRDGVDLFADELFAYLVALTYDVETCGGLSHAYALHVVVFSGSVSSLDAYTLDAGTSVAFVKQVEVLECKTVLSISKASLSQFDAEFAVFSYGKIASFHIGVKAASVRR